MRGLVPLLVLTVALVATRAGAQSTDDRFHGCVMDDLVGTYEGSYGGMDCETNGPGLTCCYSYSYDICSKGIRLQKDDASGLLRGIWIYANGSKGTVEFNVNPDCTIGNGAWGYDDNNSSAWSVRKRLSKSVERDPKLESGGNTFDSATATTTAVAGTPAGAAQASAAAAGASGAGSSPTGAKPAKLDPALEDLVGEWRGYYKCEGGYENFMRLTISRENPAVRMDFGTGLRGGVVLPGGYTMTATLDPDSRHIDFTGVEWIHKPGGRAFPFLTFSGSIDGNGNKIAGEVAGKFAGSYSCSTFSVTRRRTPPPQNPDGLLFRIAADGQITATEADCMKYAHWLADNEEVHRSGKWYFNGVFDRDEMRRVLGRDMQLWQAGDHKKLARLSQHCGQLLLQGTTDPSPVVVKANEKWSFRTPPAPLNWGKYDKNGTVYRGWLQLEQGVMANEVGSSQVDQRIADMAALPPTIDSLPQIYRWLELAANKQLGGDSVEISFDLTKDEIASYQVRLQDAAREKVVDIVDGLANEWDAHPQTLAGLKASQGMYEEQRKSISPYEFAVTTLDDAFAAAAKARAVPVWPVAIATLNQELEGAGSRPLSAYPKLKPFNEDLKYLATYHKPGQMDEFHRDFLAVNQRYTDVLDAMVTNSTDDILAWFEVIPTSDTANQAIEAFATEIFGDVNIPQRHQKLFEASIVKKRAYNPLRLSRPDLSYSVIHRHWREVEFVGLNDLAYYWTALRIVDQACPNTVPRGGGPLLSFSLRLTKSAVGRLVSGEFANQAEAQRGFMLFANQIFNRPGCTVDAFGEVTGCTTIEDNENARDFIMTSNDARSDFRKLLGSGCDEEVKTYVQNLSYYAGNQYSLPQAPRVETLWAYLARTGV